MPNNVRVGTQVTGVGKASSELDNLRDKFDKLQKQGAKGVGLGIAAGATTFALGALSTAVAGVTDVIGDSIQAARDEEVSIQKLGTSLRANVKDWDGNTAAIEKTLKARMALGFSDDEQRDSLAKIVVATKDVNKALEVQRTAMDLARLKGISLADAGNALIKVEGGQFRALKALGIVLKDGATATDALAAVQRVARGQAEDYARTNEGKLLVSQVKVGEAMEKLGGIALPAVTEGLVAAGDAAEGLGNILGLLDGSFKGTTEEANDFALQMLDFAAGIPVFGTAAGLMRDEVKKSMREAANEAGVFAGKIEDDASVVTSELSGVGAGAGDMADDVDDSTRAAAKSFRELRDDMADTAQDMIDDYFDPIEVQMDLFKTRAKVAAAVTEANQAKTKDAFRAAKEDIVENLDDEASALGKLGAKGKLTAKQIDQFENDVKASYKALGIRVPAELQKIIAKLRELDSFDSASINVTVNKRRAAQQKTGKGELEFASGGRVPGPIGAPVEATVHGGEFVVSNEMQRGMGSAPAGIAGGGNHLTVNFNVGAGGGSAGGGRALAREIMPPLIAEMKRQGFLPRSATGLTG